MTAIAGCVDLTGRDCAAVCSGMLHALSEYGSGGASVRSCEGAAFGRILSLHLPEDRFDRQPLSGRSRFLLVADVRLDNRDELARALAVSPRELAALCDADVLLRAWMRWQHSALDRIVGDYAFAMFDQVDRTLTLARDPTGQRPLFFAQREGMSAFASMPSGLLDCFPSQSRLRFDVLASKLDGRPDEGDATCFDGIFRVLPGHLAVLTTTSNRQMSYWSPATDPLRLAPDEYSDCYLETLDRAVAAMLRRNSGSIAAQLSSGYDSSAVASAAARLEPRSTIVALTSAPRLGFDGPVPRGRLADESAIAATTAALHNMRHVVVRPTGGVLAPLRQHARLYQQPDRNIINVEWWNAILQAAREHGASTVLTGQLGNLTINAGGLPVLAEWIRDRAWSDWWTEARAAAANGDVRWRGILINSFGEWLPDWALAPLDRFLGPAPTSSDSFVRGRWSMPARQRGAPTHPVAPGRYYVRRLALASQDFGTFRKGSLGLSGVDERDPLADRRLIDFGFRLPPEQLFRNGVSRPLVRKALADRLPSAVLNSKLRGYQGADWYERFDKTEANALVEEIAPCAAVGELLDLGKIRAAIERWPTAGWGDPKIRGMYRTRLLTALSAGVFIQEFEPKARASPSRGTSVRGKNPAP